MATLVKLDTQTTGTLQATKLGVMTGDSGAGGVKGAVPAPAAGDTAAGKFLKADGTWAVPTTTPGPTFVDAEVPAGAIPGTAYTLAHTPNPSASLQLHQNGILLKATVDYTLLVAAITLAVPTVTGDILLAFYRY